VSGCDSRDTWQKQCQEWDQYGIDREHEQATQQFVALAAVEKRIIPYGIQYIIWHSQGIESDDLKVKMVANSLGDQPETV